MSVHICSFCWLLNLPPTEKLVLISLADQANDQGECWPGLTSIRVRTGLCERSLQNAFTKLEEKGFLRRNYRSGHSTRYLLPTVYPAQTPVTVTPRHTDTPVTQTPRHGLTPASDAPPQQMHPRSRCTPTPAADAPPPPQQMRGTPAARAPRTVIEPLTPNTISARKGSRLPDDWVPSPQLLAWAKAKRPDLDMAESIEEFKDYWKSKPGAGARKLDWDATFRNRVRDKRPVGANAKREPMSATDIALKRGL